MVFTPWCLNILYTYILVCNGPLFSIHNILEPSKSNEILGWHNSPWIENWGGLRFMQLRMIFMIYVHTFQTRFFSNQGAEKLSARIVGFLSHVFFSFRIYRFFPRCRENSNDGAPFLTVSSETLALLPPEVLFGDGCREARAALCDGGLGSFGFDNLRRGRGFGCRLDFMRVWMKRGFFLKRDEVCYSKFRRKP